MENISLRNFSFLIESEVLIRYLFIISYVYLPRADLMRAYAIPAGSILLALQARHNWRREIPEKIENSGNPRDLTLLPESKVETELIITCRY